jgi:hypothetical protein
VIEIVASNPDWPRMFEEERVSLLPLISQYVEDIQPYWQHVSAKVGCQASD